MEVSQLSENTLWQLEEWNEPDRSRGKLFGAIAKGYSVHVVSLLCGDGISKAPVGDANVYLPLGGG